MTQHSKEELKRQMDAAKSRTASAQKDEREAVERYHAALIAEKLAEFATMGGVVGKTLVRLEGPRWHHHRVDMSVGPFFVTGAEARYGRAFYTLAKQKNDGTPSSASSGKSPEVVFIMPEDNA